MEKSTTERVVRRKEKAHTPDIPSPSHTSDTQRGLLELWKKDCDVSQETNVPSHVGDVGRERGTRGVCSFRESLS